MVEDNPKIIIIGGPNGAGKTTLAPYLLRDKYGLMEYVNADTIALGLSAFQPEKAAFEAGRIMLKRLDALAQLKVSFAFESTLAGRSYAPWIAKLVEEGYTFHLLYLWLQSPELAVERVRERVRLGGHSVPEGVIYRRYKSGIVNFFKLYMPIAQTWSVYDNSKSDEPKLIAAGSKGIIDKIYKLGLWKKFKEGAR